MVTALITGASSGIGEAFARRLASDGYDLFLVARSEAKLAELCAELAEKHDIKTGFLAIDLTSAGADAAVAEAVAGCGLAIDLLINNAGFGSMGDFVKLDLEREAQMVQLNVLALVRLTHRFLPAMRQRGSGGIINVSSSAGEQPIPFMATYAATKAFVTSFSISVAEENRPFGITVVALCPGSTKTNFFEAGNIDTTFAFKGQHSPEAVVEEALRALEKRKVKFTPGRINRVVGGVARIFMGSLAARLIANKLRAIYQKHD